MTSQDGLLGKMTPQQPGWLLLKLELKAGKGSA